MSRRRRERGRAREEPGPPPEAEVPGRGLVVTRWTGIFGVTGVLTVLLGFFLLAQGSMALAPFLLILGFLVFFPLALVK